MKLIIKLKRFYQSWNKTRLSKQKVKELSLYPEQPQKKLKKIRSELFWLCRNPRRGEWTMDETIENYFNMGIDRVGENVRHYVFRVQLDTARNRKNPLTAWTLSDKWVTARYLRSCGLTTTNPVMVKTPFVSTEETIAKLRQSGSTRFFAKYMDATWGEGAFSFSLKDGICEAKGEKISYEELAAQLEGCIIEPYIDQHEALNKLYPHAVTSFRLVTICEKGSVNVILTAMLVGAGGLRTSNLHQGGLRVPIDKATGKLGEYGVSIIANRGRYLKHPDTGLTFKDFQIPFWKEAKELAILAHQCFPKIYSIGWDLAISKNGPLIIEGNDRWLPTSFQYTNGPGREFMRKYLLK